MLFDTTFVIDLEREFVREQPAKATRFLEEHRPAIPHIGLPGNIAWQAGQLSRDLRRTGSRIGDDDILIAATAICNNLPLVSRNLEHFKRSPGLRLLSY